MSRKTKARAPAASQPKTINRALGYTRVHQLGKSIPSLKAMDTDDASPKRMTRLDRDYANADGAGPNATMLSKLDKDRARARHEYMTNEFAARARDLRVDYAVGTGLRPHIKNDPALQEMWDDFVLNADPRLALSYYGIQRQALSERIEAGEVFALSRFRRPEDGLRVPMQVQLLESEYLPAGRTGEMPDSSIAGVELDLLERPAAYWLYDRHPAEHYLLGRPLPTISRYPASRVFHLFNPDRAGQLRGTPDISRALSRIRNVEAYEKADLQRKETAALLGVAVKLPSADDDVAETLGMNADAREGGQTYAMAPLEPGVIFGTPPGADISVINPGDSGTGYKDAWQTRWFGVAAGLKVPYFLLTGDFDGIEERALRFAMMDFFKTVRRDRDMLNHQLNRRVWRDFLLAAERAGWRPTAGRRMEDYLNVAWVGDPMPHIHPVQEVQANRDDIRSGGKTLGESLQERGKDLETFIIEKQAENAMLDAAGIILDCDPRYTTKAGGAQEPLTETDPAAQQPRRAG